MDFLSAPTIYIEHGGQTFPFFTCQTEDNFIFSLRVHFGADCPPPNKSVFLIGERDGPKGKEQLKAPLSVFLDNKISHTDPLKLEFVDSQTSAAEGQPALMQAELGAEEVAASVGAKRQAGKQVEARGSQQRNSYVEDKRASKLRKGRVINKGSDENGVPLSKAGQNDEILLTSVERQEVRNFVLMHWELDEVTGIPYDLTEQEDEDVELSFLEMQKSAILRGRPYGALRHYARRWVWDMNKHRTKPLKRGIEILKLRRKGDEGPNGKAVLPAPGTSRKGSDGKSEKGQQRRQSAQGKENTSSKNPAKLEKTVKRQKSGKQQKASAADDAKNKGVADSKGKRTANQMKETDTIKPIEETDQPKDDEKDVDAPPARKRKKSAKVAENEAREAKKKEEEEQPAKVTKKAAESNRKKIARQLQEARVAETLADLKGTAPAEEDSADAWLETMADRLPEIFTFDQVLEKAPRRFSDKDVATALSDSGDYVLVQGCWVVSKKYLRAELDSKASPEEIATLGYLRGYFLCLLAKDGFVVEADFTGIKVPTWMIDEALEGITNYVPDPDPVWEFMMDTDEDFIKKHKALVADHAERWKRIEKSAVDLVKSLNHMEEDEDEEPEVKKGGGNGAAKKKGKQSGGAVKKKRGRK